MDNMKKFKIIFFIVISIFIVMFVSMFAGILNPKNVQLVSEKHLMNIKYSLIQEKELNYLKLSSFEGNDKYLALKYIDVRKSGENNAINILYNIKTKSIIDTVNNDKDQLNLKDSSLIKYIDKNIFIAISANGEIFRIEIKGNSLDLESLGKVNVSKNTIFKYIYKNEVLHIITRDTKSKFNENILANNKVYSITFKNKSAKKIVDIKETTFASDDLIYSFVLDTNGNVGVVGSKSILINGEEVNKYVTEKDKDYISLLPSVDKKYKFIDSNNVWVKFLHDGSIVKLDTSLINKEYSNVHYLVNSQLNLDLNTPSNIPLVYGNDFTIYSTAMYETELHNKFIRDNSDLIVETSTNKLKSEPIVRSSILSYNYKKYVGFVNTTDGLYGFDSKGDMKLISSSTITFPFENSIIYVKNNAIYKN